MAELAGTAVVMFLLIQLNIWTSLRVFRASYSTWLVGSSAFVAAITGIALSYVGHDGSFRQAPAILITAAAISIFKVWRTPPAN